MNSIKTFLITLGIILIGFSIYLFISDNDHKDYIKIESTVSKTELVKEEVTDEEGNHEEAIYKVFVQYNINGDEYDTELGEMSGYKVGDTISIIYNPNDPTEIYQQANIIANIVLLVIGGFSLMLGIVVAIINKVKERKL